MTLFRFHIQHVSSTTSDLVSHDLNALFVVTDGRGIHRSEFVERPISAGDLLVVNCGLAHALVDTGGLRYYEVLFDQAYFIDRASDITDLPGFHALFVIETLALQQGESHPPFHLSAESMQQACHLLHTINDEFNRKEPGYKSSMMACFLQLMVYFSRQVVMDNSPQQIWRLARVMAHIEHHYRESITLEELATIADMSINHFIRIFKKLFQLAPIEYIIHLRLRKACELMEATDDPINRIAEAVGFSDGNYFARQFRKVMGISPRDFRKHVDAALLVRAR